MIVPILVIYAAVALTVFGVLIVVLTKNAEFFDPTDIDDIRALAVVSLFWPLVFVIVLAIFPFAVVYRIALKVLKASDNHEET